MTHKATVFGFGSYFKGKSCAKDIDLLIVHNDLSAESCALAIQCKHSLIRQIDHSHITMLSANEEKGFGFIKTAQAIRLGTIRIDHVEDDVVTLCYQFQLKSRPFFSWVFRSRTIGRHPLLRGFRMSYARPLLPAGIAAMMVSDAAVIISTYALSPCLYDNDPGDKDT